MKDPFASSAGSRSSKPATPKSPRKKPSKPAASQPTQSSSDLHRISGSVMRVRYASPDGDFVILSVSTAGGAVITLKGAPGCQISEGKRIYCDATESIDPKFGRQYTTQIIQEEMPQTDDGVVMYLVNEIEGIGPGLAQRLVAHFGAAGIFNVIDTEPQRLTEVEGVGQKRIDAIKASWDSNALLRSLLSGLGSFGVTANKAMRIIDQFGSNALEIVRDNPYALTCIRGIGFKTADDIAMSVGLPINSPYRIRGAISHIIEETEDVGNTALPRNAAIKSVIKLTKLDDSHTDEVVGVIESMLKDKTLFERRLNGVKCLSLAINVKYEQGIARRVRELIERGHVDYDLAKAAETAAIGLNDADQSAAICKAFLNPVSIITGRPGCGKTTVARTIVRVAKEAGLHVRLCAPTGMAADRMRDATGEEAETAHGMLGYTGTSYSYNRQSPLSGDMFFIDEGSMLDTEAAYALFQAIPDGARIVIIGDVDQIPSVGPGKVLRDLIESGRVAVSYLHTIHRTADGSEIPINAHHIIEGRIDDLDLEGVKDFRFTAAFDDSDAIAKLMDEYQHYGKMYGYDSVQVLTSRRGTDTGVHKLNDLLRRIATPPAPGRKNMEIGKQIFRVGDRVKQTRKLARLKLANGEIGTILDFDYENKTGTLQFRTKTVVMTRMEMAYLELAYASTAHGTQGCEFPVVLFVLSDSHKFSLNRNLFYTGLTRGKKASHIIGNRSCVRYAVWKVGNNRLTGLKHEILAEMPIDTVIQGTKPSALHSTVTAPTPASRPAAQVPPRTISAPPSAPPKVAPPAPVRLRRIPTRPA